MAGKMDFDREMVRLMDSLAAGESKPRLLLHVCCAPCSTAALERLTQAFEVLVYFDNPNLDSREEHARRAGEVQRFLRLSGQALQVIISPYQPEAFRAAVSGLEREPEGGRRCEACFRLRLERAALAAREYGCAFLTTTLTISPRKDAALLNALGTAAAQAAGLRFLPSDFKKRGGFQRSTVLSRQFALYRQDYCGCAFSRHERDLRRQQASLDPSQ